MAEEKKKLCFVVGPIGAPDSDERIHADWLLELIIQPVMKEHTDFYVRRADQDHRPGQIDAQMITDLLDAALVIADLSTQNPNAFYEIGIRHMAQKPIIHMQLNDEVIPFDVSLYRAIKFSRKRPRDLAEARSALAAQVNAVLTPDYQVENPVTNARGRLQLEQHATPEMKVLMDQLSAMRLELDSLKRRPLRRLQAPAKTPPSATVIHFRSSDLIDSLTASRLVECIRNNFRGVSLMSQSNDEVVMLVSGVVDETDIILALPSDLFQVFEPSFTLLSSEPSA